MTHIAIATLLCLVGLLIYQGYWLSNLYDTLQEQAKVHINAAIKDADHVELFLRVDSLSDTRTTLGEANSHGKVSFSTSFDKDRKKRRRYTQNEVKYDLETNKDSTLNKGGAYRIDTTRQTSIKIGKSFHSLELLAVQMQQALHTAVDGSVKGICLASFDSILHHNLQAANLDIKHYTQIVHLYTDSVLASSLPAGIDTTQLEKMEFRYDIKQAYAYRVFIEPTGKAVWKQMTGILCSSFILLTVLGVAFGYLIHIILKQRTLEEMKSDFTNNITHELKTPIAVAYAANDALLHFHRGEQKEEREKYLNICQEQLQRLSHLVEQILTMSMERRKGLQLHPENIVLNQLILPLAEQHRLKATKLVEICFEETEDGLQVTADRVHLSNIISNLLDNAVKYSADNVHIDIRCQRSENKHIIISICDDGIGIATENLSRIFDKFYRVPSGNLHNTKGYGLGLYYVKTMIEKMHGNIEVQSKLNKGTTFKITL